MSPTGNSTFVRGLRWALFVPCAIAAMVAVGYVIGKPLNGLIEGPSSDAARFVILSSVTALQGAAFVLGGAITAPRRRRDIAFLLATALLVLAGFALVQDSYAGPQRALRVLVQLVSPVAGFIAAWLMRRPAPPNAAA